MIDCDCCWSAARLPPVCHAVATQATSQAPANSRFTLGSQTSGRNALFTGHRSRSRIEVLLLRVKEQLSSGSRARYATLCAELRRDRSGHAHTAPDTPLQHVRTNPTRQRRALAVGSRNTAHDELAARVRPHSDGDGAGRGGGEQRGARRQADSQRTGGPDGACSGLVRRRSCPHDSSRGTDGRRLPAGPSRLPGWLK